MCMSVLSEYRFHETTHPTKVAVVNGSIIQGALISRTVVTEFIAVSTKGPVVDIDQAHFPNRLLKFIGVHVE